MQKLPPEKEEYLYLIGTKNEEYKIGISHDPYKRVKQLQTGNPHKLKLIHVIKCIKYPASYLEKRLLKMFNYNKLKGEWRRFNAEELEFICSFDSDIHLWAFVSVILLNYKSFFNYFNYCNYYCYYFT